MRRQPYRRAVSGWGSTALDLGRWRSRSARTYDGDGRGRRTRRASTELLEGHSTQGWALASRWRSRPIHARDGGSTSTGLAMGLCCLPPPPPCAGESIRQFTLGATGIPPGYTLRLGIKSGSQWRRSPSYRESAGAKRRPPSFRSPTSSRSCESTHGSLLGECTGTVFSQRLPHLLLPPGRGGCVGSQRRLLASHICDGSKSARRIDGRIGVTNRERETRGPKRPLGSPAERLSLAILLVCFVASSLVCRCFVPP